MEFKKKNKEHNLKNIIRKKQEKSNKTEFKKLKKAKF